MDLIRLSAKFRFCLFSSRSLHNSSHSSSFHARSSWPKATKRSALEVSSVSVLFCVQHTNICIPTAGLILHPRSSGSFFKPRLLIINNMYERGKPAALRQKKKKTHSLYYSFSQKDLYADKCTSANFSNARACRRWRRMIRANHV